MTSRIPEMQEFVRQKNQEAARADGLTVAADLADEAHGAFAKGEMIEIEWDSGSFSLRIVKTEPEHAEIVGVLERRVARLATELLGPPKPVDLPAPAIVFPDRRPVMVVNGFGSNYAEDPEYGRRAELRTDDHVAAVDYIIKRLDDGYEYGYRRFMLNQLNGHPKDQQLLSMEQWGGMAAVRDRLLNTRISRWLLEYTDAMLIAYLGSWSDGRYDTIMLDKWQAPATMDEMIRHTLPWRKLAPPHQIGFMFDNASNAVVVPRYDQWKAWLNERGHWCGMEALPIGSMGLVDGAQIHKGPAMVRDGHLESLEAAARDLFDGPWTFDPATTEVGIGIHRATTAEQVRAYIARGFVPYNYWTAGGTELDAAILGG